MKTSTMNPHTFSAALLLLLITGCLPDNGGSGGKDPGDDPGFSPPPTPVLTALEHQPTVEVSGRITVLERQPGSNTVILAGGETGGMFRSTDAGTTWKHIEAYPALEVTDLAWLTPQVVLATSLEDFRAQPSWIHRSTDAGLTWTPVAPAPRPACSGSPLNGNSLSITERFNPVVLAATTCGLARSTDMGSTWQWVTVADPNAAEPFVTVEGYGSNAFAGNRGKLFRSKDKGQSWEKLATEFRVDFEAYHSIAFSPLDFRIVFIVDDLANLHYTTDEGNTWVQEPAPDEKGKRPMFIRIAGAVQGKSWLYLGDGNTLHRRRILWGNRQLTWDGPWQDVEIPHADPCDVLFKEDGHSPLLLATDGGVHKPIDDGLRWAWTGTGKQGLHALQITDVVAQKVMGSQAHEDLYFATQDNYNHASSTGGSTWDLPGLGGEGYALQIPRRSNQHQESRLLGVICANCINYTTRQHLTEYAEFRNAPDGRQYETRRAFSPRLLSDASILQWMPAGPQENMSLYRSTDWGGNWTQVQPVAMAPWGLPVPGMEYNTGVHYESGQRFNEGQSERVLAVISGIDQAQAQTSYYTMPSAENIDFGFKRNFAIWAGGRNRGFLIAVDNKADAVIMSVDSGRTWTERRDLTRQLTGDGQFRINTKLRSFLSAVAWDPKAPCHILIGTMQNGVFRSTDGGKQWAKVNGSERIRYPSSIFFHEDDLVTISTYGRGLWRIHLDRRPGDCEEWKPPLRLPDWRDDWVVMAGTRDRIRLTDFELKPTCKDCDKLILQRGKVLGIRKRAGKADMVMVDAAKADFIAARALRPATPPMVVTRRYWRLSRLDQTFDLPLLKDGEYIKGLYLRDGEVVAYRIGRLLNQLEKESRPEIFPSKAGQANMADFKVGDRVELSGTGFTARAGAKVVLHVEGESDSVSVSVATGGRFTAVLPWAFPRGNTRVTALQRLPGGLRYADYTVSVAVGESRRVIKKP